MELADYWKILRAHWVSFLAITVAGALLGLGWGLVQPKVYKANASGIVSAGVNSDLGTAMAGENYAKSRVKSYVDLAKSRSVALDVQENLGIDTSINQLLSSISITNPVDTATLKVSAESNTPESAQQLAEAWVKAIENQVSEVENSSATKSSSASIVTFRSFDAAELPTSPSSPNFKIAIAVGLLVGLFMAFAYAMLRHAFDRRISSIESVESSTGHSVIGTIPQTDTLDREQRLITSIGGNDRNEEHAGEYAVAESIRELRTNLQFMNIDNPPRTIVITSALPGEGKSTVAANLAITIAASDQKVVLIDGDLRRPTIAKTFGLLEGVGLTDVLIGNADIDDVMQPWGESGNLVVLGAGKIPPNPSELLGSNTFQNLIQSLAQEAIVLIDAPPLLPVTDAAILTARTDGALVVSRVRKTTYDELDSALNNLQRVNAHALGLILNGVPLKGAQASNYGYAYKAYYRQDTKGRRSAVANPVANDEA
ncbi:polysaccharide biosynthesis tyrosine autokinase [Glutamicibacter mishrai]|uniref:polysaccharide biosynthesis tyrosine autokinase n=1 Tax=Glutamicibacter mishrai TaxID=1775880 RepID=UPI0003B3DEAA|nr:polysaccharide biosynthesis tyrosine autokinase [Glutamicibacter mishrai]UTT39041.1 polysaccharide biosynthesis tyrosine autokinase [Glutamicibacter mishrai]